MNATSYLTRLVVILALATALGGCASGGNTIPAANCPVPEAAASEYVVGPGDSLQIVVWRNEELSTVIPVRPDGKISMPLVDDMQASGKRPSALAADIEEVLGQYLRTPEVSVIVTAQGSANQIQVIGQVPNPQSVSYRDNLRVLDVIVAVGGLSEFAAGNRTDLVRQSATGQVKCRIRVKDLLDGSSSDNIRLFPGDMIVVPESRF